MSIEINYEEPCAKCDGTTHDYDRFGQPEGPCGQCNGHGMVPTEEGVKLANFIVKYFGIPAFEDMQTQWYGMQPSLLHARLDR